MSHYHLPRSPEQPLPALSRAELRRQADGWLLDGEIRQLSAATLANRALCVDKLLWFLEQKGLQACGLAELKQFLGYVTNGHEEGTEGRWGNPQETAKNKPATVVAYFSRLRTFFAYLVQEEVLPENPFASIKPPVLRDNHVQPFTTQQVNALLHACTLSAYPKRNKAIVLFLLDTGIRASELCALKMCDLDLTGLKAVIQEGKGGKSRTVYFGRNAARALKAYLTNEPEQHEAQEPVFFSCDEQESRHGLTRGGLLALIRRLGRSAKLEAVRASPHTFRHYFSVEFLRNGGNQFSLMRILGHSQLRMTSRYVALVQSDMERQHRQFSPGDRIKIR